MKKTLLIVVGLILGLNCKKIDPLITIVNIEHLDRNGIAKQISIINKYSPKVIALDFLLVADSLDKDLLLVQELANVKNLVQAVTLFNFVEEVDYWDSLEVNHPKFIITDRGYSNLTVDDDTVLVKALAMRQYFKHNLISSFSYEVAESSFGVNPKFKTNRDNNFVFDEQDIDSHFKVISANDLLEENFRKEDLHNKIVILGYVGNDEDCFYQNKEKTKKINGVEIQASIVHKILDYSVR